MPRSSTYFSECARICQLVKTVKSSITDHSDLDSPPLNTSPISSDNSAALACTINVTRSTDSEAVELPIVGFNIAIYLPLLRRRGRWTSEKTLERYIQEGSLLLHQNRVANRLSALAELSPRFFAEQDYGESRHQPQHRSRCNGKCRGVHSVLRSGVDQPSFPHTVSPLRALPLPRSDVGENKEHADDAHDTGTDTQGWIMSSHAFRGRALELHFYKRIFGSSQSKLSST